MLLLQTAEGLALGRIHVQAANGAPNVAANEVIEVTESFATATGQSVTVQLCRRECLKA